MNTPTFARVPGHRATCLSLCAAQLEDGSTVESAHEIAGPSFVTLPETVRLAAGDGQTIPPPLTDYSWHDVAITIRPGVELVEAVAALRRLVDRLEESGAPLITALDWHDDSEHVRRAIPQAVKVWEERAHACARAGAMWLESGELPAPIVLPLDEEVAS